MQLVKLLRERELKLKRMISLLEKRMTAYPLECMLVKKDKRRNKVSYKYYKYLNGKCSYLSKTNCKNEIRILSQKTYDSKMLENCRRELEQIIKLERFETDECATDTWNRLPDSIKEYSTPIEIPLSHIIERFEKTSHGSSGDKPGQYRVTTEEGILVKSKAEQIIADELYRRGIPYRYERSVRCLDDTIRSPDFTILDKRTGKHYYWEHMGMMENPEYIRKQCDKMYSYSVTGIVPGHNLIITIADDRKLNYQDFTSQVREIITLVFGVNNKSGKN